MCVCMCACVSVWDVCVVCVSVSRVGRCVYACVRV